jgi:extracellular factor (EF) 3-hydroxypalmitic acid methyl ester biosynthesis protein
MAHGLGLLANKIENLKITAHDFVFGSKTIDTSHPSAFDWVASRMHAVNYAIFEAESNKIPKEIILAELEEVRKIQAQSPFVARLQNWYRGYQGDFETVDHLLSSENKAKPHTLAFWLEKYCLNTAIAQQHRNKVGYQADRIFQTILDGINKGQRAKILIIASGSSPDVQIILDLIHSFDFLLVLNDMDKEALSFSSKKLDSITDRIQIVEGNTFQSINKFAKVGKFDLVLAGGLFDYLNDKQASFLINAIHSKLLAKDGKFVFTNIAKGNPYKYWMEYCANWFLIERTDHEIKNLLKKCSVESEKISIRKEATGLTYLIETEI